MHLERRFEEEARFGLPIIHGEHGEQALQPERLCAWSQRKRYTDEDLMVGAWHFYADDYRFEPVWKRPDLYDKQVDRAMAVLTPDFSVYRDWPIAAQLWNTYRGRWMGAQWEAKGFAVIPTVNWGDWRTYRFCFAGIEAGATVSVSTVGLRDPYAWRLFRAGYEAMVETIKPSLVLVYGERWEDGMTELAPVARYSPKGVLEMRARLGAAVDRRQLKIPEVIDG